MALSLANAANGDFLIDSDDDDSYESLSRSLNSNVFGGFEKTRWASSSKDDFCKHDVDKVIKERTGKERDYLFKWAESDAIRQRQRKLWDDYEANQTKSVSKYEIPPTISIKKPNQKETQKSTKK
ncbi:uncharacterized protein TRIADDRAFT_52248 [Trichoplax adhaerens]|uniref:Expressed protein n=1 Tax=Trichoplax adhaerens TaxID=10228 RepID=B3RM62_TRIAD|nr:expressed protein [Trichoplax adhaerens]EDV28909.1 expressed protein [Trichoplax adhaerens]|eukprot:XP_002108111.1 expressed protein [Trichoplax adhaerens]